VTNPCRCLYQLNFSLSRMLTEDQHEQLDMVKVPTAVAAKEEESTLKVRRPGS
jgi:hypothetical protein